MAGSSVAWLGRWSRPSRIAEGFVTASLVFCVGPLTHPRLARERADRRRAAARHQVDARRGGSIAFAAALGPGVALSALTVLVVQGGIAGGAFLLRDVMDEATILAVTAAGGVILLGVALRLLELKPVRVASFLPALLLAPIFVRLAGLVRDSLG